MTRKDVSHALARNMVRTKYEQLPAEVVEVTKKSVLDTLGVIAAASTTGQGCKEIVELVKESGAKGKSTIIGYGGKVPSWLAGFANGSMVHQLDYDDVGGAGHPSACSIPAAFAVAEEVGGVNGREFITAVALAIDLYCRIGFAIGLDKPDAANRHFGWGVQPLIGYFSATAAAGRILGLTEDGVLDAFGHTLQQAAGSKQVVLSPGSIFRGISDGFPIKAGILSALMANKGLPGTRDSLEGKAGLFNLYFRGAYDRSFLTDGLGKRFENTKVGFKPWPCCALTHTPIDATLGILRQHDILPDNIKRISVWSSERMYLQAERAEWRLRPQTSADAKYSPYFALGVAATKRNVVIKDFTPDGLKDPGVLRMARKVRVRIDPDLKESRYSTIVKIATKDGKQYSNRVDFPYGCPQKPIAQEDLVAKFTDCVSYSAKPLSEDEVEEIINMVNNLEDIGDVSCIIRPLG